MELRCWGGDWGLPSVHSESLVVLVRFCVVGKNPVRAERLLIWKGAFTWSLFSASALSFHANVQHVLLFACHIRLCAERLHVYLTPKYQVGRLRALPEVVGRDCPC